MDVDELARTDIADHALTALRESNIREVVLLGRRGPAQAAYSNPEFLALGDLTGVDVVVDDADLELDPVSARAVEEDVAALQDVVGSGAGKPDLFDLPLDELTDLMESLGGDGEAVRGEAGELRVEGDGVVGLLALRRPLEGVGDERAAAVEGLADGVREDRVRVDLDERAVPVLGRGGDGVGQPVGPDVVERSGLHGTSFASLSSSIRSSSLPCATPGPVRRSRSATAWK